ncbi:MAG: NAD-glutamate dehydrogenase domain-containing protein, partial [Alphaproteobacteria bacterium]
ILRRFLNLIQCTHRTNFYQPAAAGRPKPYLSLKLDSERVDELPLPRPFREIFVYSPRVEGIHLRGGRVARGGLRWSDRREDFRTEVLGLMKAQMVKNTVIVPVGSKGGFVPKRLPTDGDREAWMQEGIACYKIFISGLLDITDNLVGDELVAPANVIRHDGPAPYLVVAADKGTASFSDIANSVAEDYDFWLGDAFASGGAAGYDHKKMAITACGAWESVKRHFREVGHDIQNEDFTVIGCGDMSGDVFGNGMLLSKHIKLVAAFDHRNIFIDPDPDPATSWTERKRLFDLPRSSWEDYDAALISAGGGVFNRRAKSIPISAEMKRLLDITEDRLVPSDLLSAMLRAEVDLLWFGGIGTYVKASDERQAEAGDRTNDGLRVDGRELRAKVIGEGANLGLTQRGRIEYGLAGGRLNTDFVDNSGGVDCSDHEVNIKVLLNTVVADGEMTRKQRDRLLAEMTDEVGLLVLHDNYLQTQTLTMAESQGPAAVSALSRFMRNLERAGRLNREVEFLPDDEVLADRQNAALGLGRPELSVLLAYAKMELYDALLDSEVPDEPHLVADLIKYFPRPVRKRFRDVIPRHRLHREIIATILSNAVINRGGITFVSDLQEETDAAADEIARAFVVARETFDLRPVWIGIQSLDNEVPAATQVQMNMMTQDLLHRAASWFLRNSTSPLAIVATVQDFA